MKRRVILGLAVVIVIALFVAARRAASWRPVIIGQQPGARALLLSANGARLFSTGQTETQVWNTQTRARIGRWTIADVWMRLAPDGAHFVTARTRVVRDFGGPTARTRLLGEVREARTGAKICQFSQIWTHSIANEDALQDLRWGANGREIWILTNSALCRFDARDGTLLQRVTYDAANGFTSWQLSPDARLIIATDRAGAHFFSAKTGQKTRFWKHPVPATRNSPVLVRALLPGGQWVFMQRTNGPNKQTALFVRAGDGKLMWSKPQITTATYSFEICGFSGDGELVLSLEGEHIVARRSANGQEVWHLDAFPIQAATLAADGRFVYCVDVQGTIRRWNVPTP